MVDIREAARFQIRKAEDRIAARERRRRELIDRAAAAAGALRAEYGATRVWMFGSILRDWFHEGSDLDLAVEGIAAERLGEAWDRAMEIVGESVDLVSLDDADPLLRKRIVDTGRPIP